MTSPACTGAASTATVAGLSSPGRNAAHSGYLARNEGINQAGLADLLEIRPMTLVRQVDRMQEAGWIERRPDPTDRRARRLFLTEKARPILGRIWDVASATQDQILAGLATRRSRHADRPVAPRAGMTLTDRTPGSGARTPLGGARYATSAARAVAAAAAVTVIEGGR